MEITNELKLFELSLIWSEAKYNFAFWDKLPNLNWDQEYQAAIPRILKTTNVFEYYLELKRFISLLKDGHTNVWWPDYIDTNALYTSKLPIRTQLIGGQSYRYNLRSKMEQ